ncbi:outer membrane beta-barrel protein [Tunicatimonas pelagia]|uniref:outer membrane beta-barrel protein n=1 Tax=Tunicatimonas pelagia TaxID=931531 RepID=UPI002666EB7E|nr:outer membrane beta-barrel protein [Tunicatimonas pelagia]WKN44103.1 outer membrane beta-barrel protein [Tunicatimonas pelagia]
MKKVLLAVYLLFHFTNTYCQSTDINVNLNSGLFSFAGESAVSSSWINLNAQGDGYTNTPYGSQGGLSYGISTSITQFFNSNFLIGAELGYELLRSKVEITRVSGNGGGGMPIAADGQTYLRNRFINLFPKIGYRWAVAQTSIDLSVGMDIGYCLSAQEKGNAEAGTQDYTTERDRKTIDTDIRPRIQANVSKGKYGGYVGYSRGIKNYKSGFIGGTNEAYSRLIRFGLTYRVN